jgi:hypothetical protein
MRYELTTLSGPPSGLFCRTTPEACRGSTTDVSSTAFSGYYAPAHHGAICRRALGLTRLELTTGETHDNRLVTEPVSDLKSGAMLLADRDYDAD